MPIFLTSNPSFICCSFASASGPAVFADLESFSEEIMGAHVRSEILSAGSNQARYHEGK